MHALYQLSYSPEGVAECKDSRPAGQVPRPAWIGATRPVAYAAGLATRSPAMAKAPAYEPQSAWEDRWNVPAEEDLLKIFTDQQMHILRQIMDGFLSYAGVQRRLQYHGESWKWSWIYELVDDKGKVIETMGYVIPTPENPMTKGATIIVTLKDDALESMPFRRLNRYIREAVKTATSKQAVEDRWVTFNPSASTEVEHIMDLYKRKYKFLTKPA